MGADNSATMSLRMPISRFHVSRFRVQLSVRRLQGRGDVGQQGRKRARHGGAAGDQNIVMAGASQKGQQLRRSGAQAALGAVAHHGIADLFAGSETHAKMRGSKFGGGASFQGYGAFDTANAARRPQEVGTLFQAL